MDAEGPIQPDASAWAHVKQRVGDEWEKPASATEDHLHLMVQVMEAWFLADPKVLRAFYGNEFHENALPKGSNIEKVPKGTIFESLTMATSQAKTKGPYGKGAHSFKLHSRFSTPRW